MDEQGLVLQEPRPELGKEQKVGLIFVIIAGGAACLLGAFYLWHHMAAPFVISYSGPRLTVGSDAAQAAVEKEKSTDTDGDGLSDYDEKNIYGTSPYLLDTDSDGINDKVEVTSGTDPLCKQGSTCTQGVADSGAFVPSTAANTFIGDVPAPTAPVPPSGVGGDSTLSPSAVNGALTADDVNKLKQLTVPEIRDVLISSGADSAKINAMSDADVTQVFQDLLTSLSGQTADTSTPQ